MEAVSVLFYWGGNTLQDPEEGFSYDIPPKGFYNVPLHMSLMELESMLLPKVASTGEAGQLRFTCRFPFRNWKNVTKYRPFPINDDESFSTLLRNRSIFPSCLEIYVQMEYAYGEEQMMPSPILLVSFNAPAKMSKQSKRFLTSTSPEKWSLAAEIVESNVDLLIKILLRLLAKSLIKFKCVSNHWLSLISDSNFAINHTRRNPTPLVSGIYVHSHWCHTSPLNDQVLLVSVAGHCRNSLPTFSFLDHASSTSTATYDPWFLILQNHLITRLCYLVVLITLMLPDWLYTLPNVHLGSTWISYLQLTPESGRSAILNGAIIWMSCKDWRGNCSRHEHIYSRLDVDAEKLAVTRVPSDPYLSKYTLYFGECGGRLLLIQLPTHDATEFSILEMDTDAFAGFSRTSQGLKKMNRYKLKEEEEEVEEEVTNEDTSKTLMKSAATHHVYIAE
ncbi:hypothetical protein RHMOL_Rhmol04G0112400 [Rhododendron molle]|uniref:Uncharacterized protein n=1 Tax=Rhododendron molle TaxID=49168 RepID=A0ACC0P1C6_RHOML|nr:hypothetical protein RHMOL_Rhmol04G0112400 [Rhododendron molle]